MEYIQYHLCPKPKDFLRPLQHRRGHGPATGNRGSSKGRGRVEADEVGFKGGTWGKTGKSWENGGFNMF